MTTTAQIPHPISLGTSRSWWLLAQALLLLGDVGMPVAIQQILQRGWFTQQTGPEALLVLLGCCALLLLGRSVARWVAWSHVPGAHGRRGNTAVQWPDRASYAFRAVLIIAVCVWASRQPVLPGQVPQGINMFGLMGAMVAGTAPFVGLRAATIGPARADRLWHGFRPLLTLTIGIALLLAIPTTRLVMTAYLLGFIVGLFSLAGSRRGYASDDAPARRVRVGVAGVLVAGAVIALVLAPHSLVPILMANAITVVVLLAGNEVSAHHTPTSK